ncbi:MAG: hypothetical protein ACKPE2_16530, partial [Dolichospermum sp.]
ITLKKSTVVAIAQWLNASENGDHRTKLDTLATPYWRSAFAREPAIPTLVILMQITAAKAATYSAQARSFDIVVLV